MKPPIIVTGHGRSGTHWLASVLGHFVDARHEPQDLGGDVVVSCRLYDRLPRLAEKHRVLHLVRDGREVVRSAYEFYGGQRDFTEICRGWSMVVEGCRDLETVRLEDLMQRRDVSPRYRLTHWREWPEDLTETFWANCGEQMTRHGYTR